MNLFKNLLIYAVALSNLAFLDIEELPITPEKRQGVRQDFLDSKLEVLSKEETEAYYSIINYWELKKEFIPLSENEGAISKYQSMVTALDNFILIEKLNKSSYVQKKYGKLKGLLNKCNKIRRNTETGSLERLRKIYLVFSKYVCPGELTNESIDITRLVNGKKGDCNDVCPAYHAILNYYGINCVMIYGRSASKKTEEQKERHVWLRVKINDDGLEKEFELDPTWNLLFAPLEIRNYSCEVFSLKNE